MASCMETTRSKGLTDAEGEREGLQGGGGGSLATQPSCHLVWITTLAPPGELPLPPVTQADRAQWAEWEVLS